MQIGVESPDFSGCSILSRTEFQQPGQIQKVISPKPLVISGCEDNHWEEERLFYNYCNGLSVRF
jgi:hypothetical protein